MASKRTKNFEAWLQSRGVELRGAEIADDAENVIAGRGVVAAESLKAGTELLRVPLSATFRRDTSLLRKPLRKARLTGWLALAIALSHESRIHNSPFAPYLAFLPTEHELQSPILWSPEGRALLEGTGLDVRSSPAAAEECYHDVVKPFFTSLPGSVSPPTLREFMRAGAVIAAYAFELGPGKETTLVPVADALNANAGSPHTRLSVLENANALHMVLERDVHADTEVFNTYGIRAPSERLLRYGYLDVVTDNDDSALLCSEILDAASEPTGLRLSRVRIAIRKLGEVGCIVWSAERKEAPFMSRERVLPLKRVQEAEEMFRRCGVGKNEVLAPALRARLQRIQCARPITKKGSHRARMALELRTGDQKRFEQALSALGLSPESSGKRSTTERGAVGLSKD